MNFCIIIFFFFNDTATTEIYTLSLHDALPILVICMLTAIRLLLTFVMSLYLLLRSSLMADRKSGSAGMPRPISYAVFCLKKKKRLHILIVNVHINTGFKSSVD